MSLRHNKKRNVGLVYEFLARYLAKAIIENRDADITKAKAVIKRNFNKQTDLYKELRLFKALYESTFTNREACLSLVNRVKEAVKEQSQQRIDLEKTSLIHEINSELNQDGKFFDDVVSNCVKLEESGINCFLMETRYNKKQEKIAKVVKDFNDLYNKIGELKMKKENIILDTDM
jgi:hypothetical protein